MRMRRTAYHLLTIIRVFALWCVLFVVVKADPVSGAIAGWAAAHAILASLAVSAVTSLASFGLQRLLIRPKTQKQNRAGDSVLIQMIEFIYA